jgi:hypothetical protein
MEPLPETPQPCTSNNEQHRPPRRPICPEPGHRLAQTHQGV